MPLAPIIVQLIAQGAGQVASQVISVAGAIEDLGESGKSASQDISGMADALRTVGANTTGINAAEQAIRDVTKAAAEELDALGEAASKLEEMGEKAEKVRNVGLALTATGAAGIALSATLAGVAEEGNAMEARLESILKQQDRLGELDAQNDIINDVTVKGHFDDDDAIRDAAVLMDSFSVSTEHMTELLEDAARQARTMGTDVGSVAEQLAKAYNTGNVAALKKSGVTLDTSDIDAIGEAYKRSAEEGKAAFTELVGGAIRANTAALEDSLTEAQQKANDAARAMDDFQTNIGTGAKDAQSNIQALGGQIISVINLKPEMEEQAGVFLTYGSYALTAIGSIISLGAQVAQMAIAWKLAKTTQAAASVAAAAAADVEAISVGGAGAASAAGGAGAAAGSVGFGALAISIWAAVAPLLVFVAIAAAAALAMYALGKAIIWKDEQAAKKGLEDVENRRKEVYERQVGWKEKHKDKKQDPRIDVKKGESYDAWRKRHYGGEESDDAPDAPAVDMDKLNKMVADAKAGAPVVAVAGGAAVPISAIPAINTAGIGARMGGTPDVSEAQSDVDQLQSELDALKEAKRKASKSKKEAIQDQIALKQKDLARAKEELKAAKAADKEAEKRADKAAKSAAEIDKIEAGAGDDNRIAELQLGLDAAKSAHDSAKIESLTYQIEMANAGKDRDAALIDAALIEDKDERAQAQRVIAARYEAARQAAQRTSRKAGADAQAEENKRLRDVRESGEANIQKIGAKGQLNNIVGDLTDQLDAAKEAKDLAQIEALTLQIEMAKASEARQEALIDAAKISDATEKAYTIQAINAQFENDSSDARRTARRAARAGKDGKSSLSDAAIRAQMAMMGGASGPKLGGAIGINYGDRFAESDRLRPRYDAAPLHSFQSYNKQNEQFLDINSLPVPEVVGAGEKRGGKLKVKSRHQNSNGDWIFKIEDIVVPYMGLSEAGD